jgi:hypothetical protein
MGVGFRVCVAKSVKFPTVVVKYLFTYVTIVRDDVFLSSTKIKHFYQHHHRKKKKTLG